MRTWSVRGTAFALCTRSSSLSMRTRTSMWRLSLLLRTDGRAGPALREELPESPRHGLRNEVVHVAPEGRHLLDAARGEEAVLRARHEVHRLDLGGEIPVQMVHLELPLEVGDRPQALHHRARAEAAGELDDELGEDLHLDVLGARERLPQEGDPLVHAEQGRLVLRVADDADDHALEDERGAADDVHVAVRDRVVAPRADARDRLGVAHFSGPSKSVTRAAP